MKNPGGLLALCNIDIIVVHVTVFPPSNGKLHKIVNSSVQEVIGSRPLHTTLTQAGRASLHN